MRFKTLILLAIVALAGFPLQAKAEFININLGTAGNFAVLASQTVTNTGPTTITGDVGVSPLTSITGFDSVTLVAPSTIHAADDVANQAKIDLTTAYNQAAGLTGASNLTGQDLGGLTLTPGVYSFSSSAGLTGALTLNAQGNPDAEFVFQIGSTLITASNSSVVTINGALGCNVFWQVGSSATLGTTTAFQGHILADASITLTTGATILNGSALARTGAVTLDTNTITNQPNCVSPIPEPATMTMILAGGALLGLCRLWGGTRSTRWCSRGAEKSRGNVDSAPLI